MEFDDMYEHLMSSIRPILREHAIRAKIEVIAHLMGVYLNQGRGPIDALTLAVAAYDLIETEVFRTML